MKNRVSSGITESLDEREKSFLIPQHDEISNGGFIQLEKKNDQTVLFFKPALGFKSVLGQIPQQEDQGKCEKAFFQYYTILDTIDADLYKFAQTRNLKVKAHKKGLMISLLDNKGKKTGISFYADAFGSKYGKPWAFAKIHDQIKPLTVQGEDLSPEALQIIRDAVTHNTASSAPRTLKKMIGSIISPFTRRREGFGS
jgi:hypothetical protein